MSRNEGLEGRIQLTHTDLESRKYHSDMTLESSGSSFMLRRGVSKS